MGRKSKGVICGQSCEIYLLRCPFSLTGYGKLARASAAAAGAWSGDDERCLRLPMLSSSTQDATLFDMSWLTPQGGRAQPSLICRGSPPEETGYNMHVSGTCERCPTFATIVAIVNALVARMRVVQSLRRHVEQSAIASRGSFGLCRSGR